MAEMLRPVGMLGLTSTLLLIIKFFSRWNFMDIIFYHVHKNVEV